MKRRPSIATPTLPLASSPPASTPELADIVMHEEPATSRPLGTITPHPSPSRPLDARHVLDMARSIAALGLIHPLALDLDGTVLAGSHRLAALRVLAEAPEHRTALLRALCPHASAAALEALAPVVASLPIQSPAVVFASIPVRIMPLRLTESPEEAWRVEVAENERRRDYSAPEVRAIATRLRAQGYHLSKGPGGARPLALPVLTALVGRSERQVRRMLADELGENRTKGRSQMEADRQAAANALEKFRRRYGSGLSEAQVKKIRQALEVLDSLAQ
jgi:hypothetical protein